MSTLQSQIQHLSRAIEEHRRDLRTLYGDLGKAAAAEDSPSAQDVLHKRREYETQEELYQRLTSSLRQFEDRSRKLKQVQKDLKLLSRQKKELSGQLGAIAYEAYGNTRYSEELAETLARENASGARWGDMGYMTPGRLPPVVDEEIFSLTERGDVAMFESKAGFHLFRITDLRPGRNFTFEESRQAVKEDRKSVV